MLGFDKLFMKRDTGTAGDNLNYIFHCGHATNTHHMIYPSVVKHDNGRYHIDIDDYRRIS